MSTQQQLVFGNSGAQFISATGGTITESGDYRIHTFTGSGTFQVTAVPVNGTVDYCIVAGGGGSLVSSGHASAGSGGGGVLLGSTSVIVQAYAVTVGGGGYNSNGSNSVFNGLTAIGGGRGGGYNGSWVAGSSGGSGGGSDNTGSGTPYGGNGTPGQGYKGAKLSANEYVVDRYEAAGGGAGGNAVGFYTWYENYVGTRKLYHGGPGKYTTIRGVGERFGGGGGASRTGVSHPNRSLGGSGGGGTCGNSGWIQNAGYVGGSGGVNTGGGSSGGWPTAGIGSGGSGIVIIRYKYK